ncbi:hypothetical protein HanPSC8_Chr09g0366751 [Helianthus annuus]|nr:hypothetical protein HanPSC8_Chr09g0366751 [Helianthus annuus]
MSLSQTWILAVSLTRTPPPRSRKKLWRMHFLAKSLKAWEKLLICHPARSGV